MQEFPFEGSWQLGEQEGCSLSAGLGRSCHLAGDEASSDAPACPQLTGATYFSLPAGAISTGASALSKVSSSNICSQRLTVSAPQSVLAPGKTG